MSRRSNPRAGFSLLELVIVIVIIGIIAAIAIPRMSRGAAGAADSALSGNLAVLRNAIDLYAAEHTGAYPKLATISDQLTKYSDHAGATSDTKDADHPYGPYVRAIPPLPVGADKGKTSFVGAYTAGNGWVYDEVNGTVTANCADTEVDATNKKYNAY
jgi:general secretion pathway protein G